MTTMSIVRQNNKERWNRNVLSLSQDALFQAYEWNGTDRIEIIENGKLIGLSSSTLIQSKRGRYVHVRHGPLFSKKASYDALDLWINYIKEYAKENKASFIRISPRTLFPSLNYWNKNGFKNAPLHNMDAEQTYIVPISSDEQMLARMRKTTRYLVKKAINSSLKVTRSNNTTDFTLFLEMFSKTSMQKGYISDRNFDREYKEFIAQKKGEIYIVWHEKKPVGASLILYFGNQAIYHYASHITSNNRFPVSYALIWSAIQHCRSLGLTYFNLWGGISDSINKNHPWYGLDQFKRGFGGEIRQYYHAQDLPLTLGYLKTYAIETAVKYIRGYQTIGPFQSPPGLRKVFRV